MLSKPIDLDGLRRLRALKISEIETGMEDKTRKRNEKMEKT
jgi:hypothetical protein